MAININHFDTLTRQDLEIEENIKNSLAEYLFPDAEFAIGSIYQEITTPENLDRYQEKTLQFASGERMYFSNDDVRELLYPKASDGYLSYKNNNKQQQQWFIFFTLSKITMTHIFIFFNEYCAVLLST